VPVHKSNIEQEISNYEVLLFIPFGIHYSLFDIRYFIHHQKPKKPYEMKSQIDS